jgi:hypothetical protein
MERVPDKERQSEFYMETTSTTRIVSILVSLVLLGQGDTYGYKYKTPRRRENQHKQPTTAYTQHTSQHTPRQAAGYRQQRYAWIDPIRYLQRPAVGI